MHIQQIRTLTLILIGLAVAPMMAGAQPRFITSGYAPQLDEIIVAETPRGEISVLDVYLFDHFDQGTLGSLQPQQVLEMHTLTGQATKARLLSIVQRMIAMEALAERSPGVTLPAHALDVASHPAIAAVYIEEVLRDEIEVTYTDIQKYYLENAERFYNRRQAEIRYIFIETENFGPAMIETESILLDARRRIAAGETTFEEAARELSDAPSAENGGLIAPFYNGTYFDEFERRAFSLQEPGQITPAFRGPEGIYMIQLVSVTDPFNAPIEEVADEIEAELNNLHVEPYLKQRLKDLVYKQNAQNYALSWTYLNDDAPLARIGSNTLTRPEYFHYFADPTDSNYFQSSGRIAGNAQSWLHGELLQRELTKRGITSHEWIARSKEMVTMIERARATIAKEVETPDFRDVDALYAVIQENPRIGNFFRNVHLIEFQLDPENLNELLPSEARAVEGFTQSLSTQISNEKLPTQDLEPLDLTEWVETYDFSEDDAMDTALDELREITATIDIENLEIEISDYGWVAPLPGSEWVRLLGESEVGQASAPDTIQDQYRIYLIVEEAPLDLQPLLDKPFLVSEILYDHSSEMMIIEQYEALDEQQAFTMNL